MSDEINQKPKAMLVHDPAVSECLKNVSQENHLELLFTLTPNPNLAASEHTKLRQLLNELGIKTIDLFDVISDADKDKLRFNPNIIFTRDPLITLPWLPGFGIIGRMQKPLRQP